MMTTGNEGDMRVKAEPADIHAQKTASGQPGQQGDPVGINSQHDTAAVERDAAAAAAAAAAAEFLGGVTSASALPPAAARAQPQVAAAGPGSEAPAQSAAGTLQAAQNVQQQQQQDQRQQQVRQYLAAEQAVTQHYTQRMQPGDSRLRGLLAELQGMRRIALTDLLGPAGGDGQQQQQQQQQQVQQYLNAYYRAMESCTAVDSTLAALGHLDTMCSIALGPLALGNGA
jgi:hypothetical protein